MKTVTIQTRNETAYIIGFLFGIFFVWGIAQIYPLIGEFRIKTEKPDSFPDDALGYRLRFESAGGQFQVALDEFTMLTRCGVWRACRPYFTPTVDWMGDEIE